MKRVGIYLRVSTLDQSTDLQKEELLEYLDARGWTQHEIYEDTGKTGTNSNRPALKKLIVERKRLSLT